jgi:hypothetical protein
MASDVLVLGWIAVVRFRTPRCRSTRTPHDRRASEMADLSYAISIAPRSSAICPIVETVRSGSDAWWSLANLFRTVVVRCNALSREHLRPGLVRDQRTGDALKASGAMGHDREKWAAPIANSLKERPFWVQPIGAHQPQVFLARPAWLSGSRRSVAIASTRLTESGVPPGQASRNAAVTTVFFG